MKNEGFNFSLSELKRKEARLEKFILLLKNFN